SSARPPAVEVRPAAVDRSARAVVDARRGAGGHSGRGRLHGLVPARGRAGDALGRIVVEDAVTVMSRARYGSHEPAHRDGVSGDHRTPAAPGVVRGPQRFPRARWPRPNSISADLADRRVHARPALGGTQGSSRLLAARTLAGPPRVATRVAAPTAPPASD